MNAKPGHAGYHLVDLQIAGDSTKKESTLKLRG
jgi:hypothetical protein